MAMNATDASDIKIQKHVISGQGDLVLGQGTKLARALGQGSYIEVPDADHFSLATTPEVKVAVANFMRSAAAQRA